MLKLDTLVCVMCLIEGLHTWAPAVGGGGGDKNRRLPTLVKKNFFPYVGIFHHVGFFSLYGCLFTI